MTMTTMTGTEREVLSKLRLYKTLVYAHQTTGTQVAMVRPRARVVHRTRRRRDDRHALGAAAGGSVTNDEIRQHVRSGNKIAALKALRARDNLSLKDAQVALAAMLSPDDEAAFRAVVAAAPADPWIESAPGIYEPKSQVDRSKAGG
jgi:hypothetical protein